MATTRELDADGRRMLRLRHELEDEGIRMPQDESLLALLLAELDYARHPHAHEGVAPRYGAIVATPDAMRRQPAAAFEVVDIEAVPLAVARRLADGRSSFVARIVGDGERLVCFDRTREYESSAVHLAAGTGAYVVQRLGRGWIRLSTPAGVATFDGIHWSKKRLAGDLAAHIAPHVPGADPDVLGNIVELCTHWLGAGRVGASLVWSLDGDPLALDRIGMGAAVEIPRLDLSHRAHFAALLNALAQYDRAALVDPDGIVTTVGVQLRTSGQSRRLGPVGGTRHTSALRFSAEEPHAIVFVVSSSGPLSVFHRGEKLDLG